MAVNSSHSLQINDIKYKYVKNNEGTKRQERENGESERGDKVAGNKAGWFKGKSSAIASIVLGIIGAVGLWFPLIGIAITIIGMSIGIADSLVHETKLANVGVVISLFFFLLSITSIAGFGFTTELVL